jgi:hypothetical protein
MAGFEFFTGFHNFLVYNIDTRKVLLQSCYWLSAESRIMFSSDGRQMALIGEIALDEKKTPYSTDTEPDKLSCGTL